MRATLPLKRITLLFDYGETILLNRTNTFDTNYNTFNARESNEQAERINLRYKIIIVSIEQWKKKREKKRKKEKKWRIFYRISTKHAWFIFYKSTLVSVQTRTLALPYEHLLLILSSDISILYYVKYPHSFFSFSSIYRQLSWSVN